MSEIEPKRYAVLLNMLPRVTLVRTEVGVYDASWSGYPLGTVRRMKNTLWAWSALDGAGSDGCKTRGAALIELWQYRQKRKEGE